MNSTSPGLHMDLLPPHVKEEENGLGVLRNSVSPGRAPGERDGQVRGCWNQAPRTPQPLANPCTQ